MLFPSGYSTSMVTVDELFKRHHLAKMHPEYARRLRAWLIANEGRIGIGGSWRAVQPVKPGFAPEGKSFHQSQQFSSGRVAFCAVDLVHVVPGKKHRAPTWDEVPKKGSQEAKRWGLHCNVTRPSEPWHIQPIELDGFGGWVRAGRPEPQAGYPLPGVAPAPAPAGPVYPGQPLRLGSKAEAVKHVQRVVGATQDGDYGLATERRVKAWQKQRGMFVDGVVGPVTWKAMFG
jgi:peptidoglycan hydrolase-like protein with peptidoglycan-binding domain